MICGHLLHSLNAAAADGDDDDDAWRKLLYCEVQCGHRINCNLGSPSTSAFDRESRLVQAREASSGTPCRLLRVCLVSSRRTNNHAADDQPTTHLLCTAKPTCSRLGSGARQQLI
ncbi:hypothetical protein QAD02_003168 [Eretmocerus hayati]|uniref:Uncharacterized protein n=1 Tax=Eretmocerus hayati TaxID=131215 RepID=A0ACC2NLD6_9HYME|nr:hypothetical protein QAD02_003168 [Eretmocerus hayati]